MNLENIKVFNQNITLVYKHIDLKAIDTRKLEALIKSPANVVKNPEMILIIFQVGPTLIQIADNRIRITLQNETTDLNNIGSEQNGIHLWKIALEAHRTVESQNLVAYGFNYQVTAAIINGEITQLLNQKLTIDIEKTNNIFQTDHIKITPRLKFERDGTEYDLIIDPVAKKQFMAHLNAHFNATTFPTQKMLQDSFRSEFGYFVESLQRLFEEPQL